MKRSIHLLRLSLAYSVLFSVPVFAQNSLSYLNDTGVTPYGVNIPVENGFIDVSNGNLHLEFPLATHQQRGALSLSERLVYDSRIWMFSPLGNHYQWWPYNVYGASTSAGGWRFVTGNEVGAMNAGNATLNADNMCFPGDDYSSGRDDFYQVSLMIYTDVNGTNHPMDAGYQREENSCSTQDNPTPPGETYSNFFGGGALDGSGYQTTPDQYGNWTVTDSNGTQVYPNVADRYGNFWSADASGNLIDDLGRTPVIVSQANSSVTNYDVLAPNGPYSNNGTRVRYIVTTAPISVQTQFGQNGISEWGYVLYPIQSIQLPDGAHYSFTYDSYGELSSITLPTGGVVQYGYANYVDAAGTPNRWLSSRAVDSNPALTLTPSHMVQCTPACDQQVLLHKPSGDETMYYQALNNGAWTTGIGVYNGLITSGHLIETVSNLDTYTNGCVSGVACTGANYVSSQLSRTDLYPNNAAAQQNQIVESKAQSTYDPLNHRIVSLKQWDYYIYSVGPSTNPTSETDYSYEGYDLSQVKVLDGAGNQAALTNYGYTSSATATSGITGHGTQNAGGPYLQTVSRWLNTVSAPATPYITTTYTMDDTGQVRSVQDPRLNTAATITYQCSNSLPLQVTNALSQSTTYAYDCNSGAIMSSTDPNAATTAYAYEATAGRIQTITYPDTGTTTYNYPSATEVDTTVAATPDPSITSASVVDSFGRNYQQSQNGISSETSYDVNGRVACVTNPHAGSSSASTNGSTCITSYDGLDRPLTQQQPDGNSVQWMYALNTTTTTDENGNQMQRTSDAFGHLKSVTELLSGSTSLTSNYAYDGLGNLTTITQLGNGTSDAPRVRTFTYDSLSRLICASNPEIFVTSCPTTATASYTAGTIAYTYDANGNLIYKNAPAPNTLRSSGTTVGINYAYDALNRLTAQWSTDGSVVYNYSYDYTGYGSFGIGRLFGAFASWGGGTGYYYDPMGRIKSQSFSTPSMNGGWQQAFGISYNLAGNITSLTYPDGRVVKQTWDPGAHLQTVTYDNWNGQTTTSSAYQSYLTAATYFPNGSPQSMTFGNGTTQTFILNNRLQPIEIKVQPSAHSLTQSVLDKTVCYGPASPGCANYGISNNGNVLGVNDVLNTGRYQGFTYDSLNRLSTFGTGDQSISQVYSYDSFGNMNQTSGSYQTNLSFGANNQINTAGFTYDAAGNLMQTNVGGVSQSFAYDAENRLVSVNNGASAYTYNSVGERVRKDIGTGGTNWTEYVSFNSQPMAEKNADGTWSDYIYANGQVIARADAFEYRLHIHGQMLSAGNSASWTLPFSNYTIANGDKLFFREYQVGTIGGVRILFSDNTYSSNYPGDNLLDQDGFTSNFDTTQNAWHQRVFDMSSYAGKTINAIWVNAENQTPVGTWDSYFADMVILKADGTVYPLYTGQSSVSLGYFSSANVANTYAEVQKVSPQNTSGWVPNQQFFYHGDHLGSARLLTAYGGWPVSSETYYPFGLEVSANPDPNHYKFTGLEHDQESGLDHAMFRQYSSTVGRWISPDPYLGSIDLTNPQSFNRYTYAMNNPLRWIDPSGLDTGICTGYTVSQTWDEATGTYSTPAQPADPGDCAAANGQWNTTTSASTPPSTTSNDWIYTPDPDGFNGGIMGGGGGDPDDAQIQQLAAAVSGQAGWIATPGGVAAFYGASAAGAGVALTAPGAIASIIARPIGWYLATASGAGAAVLGKFPEYLDDAEELGANVFSMAPRLYNFLANYGQAWTANQAFLNRVAATGQQIYLSNQPLGQSGAYAQELNYLIEIGAGPQTWRMVPR